MQSAFIRGGKINPEKLRDEVLRDLGLRVLRIDAQAVNADIDSLLSRILETLE